MSIKLGGTWYDFAYGSLESLGGKEGLKIYHTESGSTLAILDRSPARLDDAEAVGEAKMIDPDDLGPIEPQKMAYKKRSEFSYLTEIIEKALISGDLQTALTATLALSQMPREEGQ